MSDLPRIEYIEARRVLLDVQSALHELMERSLNPIAARRQQEQSRPPGGYPDETTAWGTR